MWKKKLLSIFILFPVFDMFHFVDKVKYESVSITQCKSRKIFDYGLHRIQKIQNDFIFLIINGFRILNLRLLFRFCRTL